MGSGGGGWRGALHVALLSQARIWLKEENLFSINNNYGTNTLQESKLVHINNLVFKKTLAYVKGTEA